MKEDPRIEIQEGLAEIEKCLQLNPDLPAAYATKANLLLMKPHPAPPDARAAIVAESIKNFERAFSMNPLLQNKENERFQTAKSLGAAPTSL